MASFAVGLIPKAADHLVAGERREGKRLHKPGCRLGHHHVHFHPRRCRARTSSAALYAAMPPETPTVTRISTIVVRFELTRSATHLYARKTHAAPRDRAEGGKLLAVIPTTPGLEDRNAVLSHQRLYNRLFFLHIRNLACIDFILRNAARFRRAVGTSAAEPLWI